MYTETTCNLTPLCRFATKAGVDLMTFDNEDELHKIKSINPSAKLVLRILADDPSAICNVRFCCKAIQVCVSQFFSQLGNKFGAEVDFAPYLLSVAKKLDLAIVGVRFVLILFITT